MDYTLAQFHGFDAAVARAEADNARLAIAAARAGWADQAGYDKLMRALG